MKVIGIGIKPTVIFDMCSYYSLNRVFMQDDPNNTHIVNNAFALTEDDRKFFSMMNMIRLVQNYLY